MKFNELTTKPQKTATRLGRGISSGKGKTAGRGTKGQGSRKSSLRQGFSGGQTPLHMQMPKLRGFKSKRTSKVELYTGQLDALKGTVVDNESLFNAGLTASPHVEVKLLLKGEIKSKKTVKVQAASAGATEAVNKAGGNVQIIERQPRPAKMSTEKDA
jgi:large subunit ribosomal protein L15